MLVKKCYPIQLQYHCLIFSTLKNAKWAFMMLNYVNNRSEVQKPLLKTYFV